MKCVMFKTGNSIVDHCLTAVSFFPLLPVVLILIRKNQDREPMGFLMIICLLDFLAGGLRQITLLDPFRQAVATNILTLFELVFLILLFRTTLDGMIRTPLNFFLIAFLSVMITVFTIEGWQLSNVGLDTVEALVIAGVIGLSLPPLIRRTDPYIFRSPLTWIAGGTLFYFFTLILLEWVGGSCFAPVSQGLRSSDPEKMVLLSIACFIRYFLYTGATLV